MKKLELPLFLDLFVRAFEKKEFSKALELFYENRPENFDGLEPKSLERSLAHFADCLTYHRFKEELLICAQHLREDIEADVIAFIDLENFVSALIDLCQEIHQQLTTGYHSTPSQKLAEFYKRFGDKFYPPLSPAIVSYPLKEVSLEQAKGKALHVYYIDEQNLGALKLCPKNSLFVFWNQALLSSALLLPNFTQEVLDRSFFLCLDNAPNWQLQCQPALQKKTSFAFFNFPNKEIEEALEKALSLKTETLAWESQETTWLYHLGKNLYWENTLKRLGKRSALSCLVAQSYEQWFDNYKMQPKAFLRKPNPLKAAFDEMLDKLPALDVAKDERKRPLLMHVVPQLVDFKHAPSALLRELIALRNPQLFDTAVCCSERLILRSGEYPIASQTSHSSESRARKTLKMFEDQGIGYYQASSSRYFIDTVERLAREIQQQAPDILVFHGPDPINCMLTRLFPKSLRVLFEHGTLPNTQGFDLAISSTKDAPELFEKEFKEMGCELQAVDFCVDARAGWQTKCVSKSFFNVPEEARVATTISNQLESRLSPDFCWSVSEILKATPDLYYVPIGEVKNSEVLKGRFGKEVRDRVIFFGSTKNPSHLARSMEFYFNEFPFGSCLGLLDGLAAGLVVITMYDPQGPAQARYGGLFLGKENSITSLKKEDYAQLAIAIAQDPLRYYKLSQHAYQVYEGHSNPWVYVLQIEKLIKRKWEEKMGLVHR